MLDFRALISAFVVLLGPVARVTDLRRTIHHTLTTCTPTEVWGLPNETGHPNTLLSLFSGLPQRAPSFFGTPPMGLGFLKPSRRPACSGSRMGTSGDLCGNRAVDAGLHRSSEASTGFYLDVPKNCRFYPKVMAFTYPKTTPQKQRV